jgi:hypothetical protein
MPPSITFFGSATHWAKKTAISFLGLITVFGVFIFAVVSGHYQPLFS